MIGSTKPGDFAVVVAIMLIAVPPSFAAPAHRLTDTAVPLSQQDLGLSVLALVDNARFAIARRDVVAALNDVSEAQTFARQLPNQPSKLIPPKEANGVTDFGALVRLNSSRAELANLRFDGADADLRAIQNGIPPTAIPRTLPVLSAAASLDLARKAVITGRTAELKTQLLTAQHAMRKYVGSSGSVAARRLAARVGSVLAHSHHSAALSYRLGNWVGQVCGWAGSERWGGAPSQ